MLKSSRLLGNIFKQPHRQFHQTRLNNKLVHFNLADIGEGIQECEVVTWFIKPGDHIHQFDKICEVQSDKASVEITSRFDGIVKSLHHKVGDMAKVGKPLIDIEVGDDVEGHEVANGGSSASAAPPVAPAPPKATTSSPPPPPKPVAPTVPLTPRQEEILSLATPAVRRIAKENGIDIRQVKGSGKVGRVLKSDVEAFVASPPNSSPTPVQFNTKQPLTPLQKSMMKNMSKSLQIPHFLYTDEIYLDEITKVRKAINSSMKDGKISYMPLLLKAFSLALSKYPLLNASLTDLDSTPTLLYKSSHNIGVAMDTPQGLVVPVIKNVESKSILQIAQDLSRLQELGKKNAIPPVDFQDATITLSNIGNIGGLTVGPVIPPGTLCIGGIGKIHKVPRIMELDGEDQVVVRQVMIVSFSADHRVVDGATMAKCVSLFKDYLENPGLLMAEMK